MNLQDLTVAAASLKELGIKPPEVSTYDKMNFYKEYLAANPHPWGENYPLKVRDWFEASRLVAEAMGLPSSAKALFKAPAYAPVKEWNDKREAAEMQFNNEFQLNWLKNFMDRWGMK